jgi:phytoene dehydrogenase-like protein
MGAITQQLAKRLGPGAIRTNTRVESVQDGIVSLPLRETLGAQAIVIATDGPEAARLLPDFPVPKSRSVICLYYAALDPPLSEPVLILNGEGSGPINNLSVVSNVCSSYAPEGQVLISVSLIGTSDEDELVLERRVRDQLIEWFPEDAGKWRYLRTYRIKHAQNDQTPPALANMERPVKMRRGIFVCGDHRDHSSIQGAMVSGRRAAEAVISDFSFQ